VLGGQHRAPGIVLLPLAILLFPDGTMLAVSPAATGALRRRKQRAG